VQAEDLGVWDERQYHKETCNITKKTAILISTGSKYQAISNRMNRESKKVFAAFKNGTFF
jgi:hypothetical protein